MRTLSNLWDKLAEPRFREAFASASLRKGLPFQIRTMRLRRGWSQEKLAEASGLKQGVISRAEDPNYGKLSFKTVLAIARGFDVAVVCKFVPFSELVLGLENESEDSVAVASFDLDAKPTANAIEVDIGQQHPVKVTTSSSSSVNHPALQ